ncbi:MAG: immunoglobulin-like domain-containing protein [Ignavibacteriales bacterium]
MDNVKIKKLTRNILIVMTISSIVVVGYFFYIAMRPKFKDLTIELGTDKVSLSNFLTSDACKDHAKVITDLTKVDFSKVSETNIKLSHKGKVETVKLKIVDTKAPVVEFQNISRYSGYKVNADDFIVDKKDSSEMNITATQIKDTTEYKDYVVEVTVKDKYGNKTTKKCTLTITWLKPIVYVELGSKFSKEMIIENMEKDADKVSQAEIEKVNTMIMGEYIINATYDNKKYKSKVVVQDTTPPQLELQNLKSYPDNELTKDNFIKYVGDASGEVITTMKQTIDYAKIGDQEVKIEAVDKNGNKIEKTATLTIISDTTGPILSGLSDLYVAKYATINYNYGVTAVDDNDGSCTFAVDASKVNTSAAGTYYATYTTQDSKGNISTAKRKVVVNHDQADTDYKFNVFYNTYLAGKDVLGMAVFIRDNIKYNYSWGGDDPVWYGLTNNAGNCYVRALIFQKALTKAGITNRLISVTDYTHYWNLVYIGGVWRHYDTTPTTQLLGPATDDQKYASSGMAGRNWNRAAYPVAN